MNQRIMKQKKRKKQARSLVKKEAKEKKLQGENWSSKPIKKKIREDRKTKTHQLGY